MTVRHSPLVIRRRHLAPVLVLLALLCLATARHAEAHLHILWRAAVLSWDSPATQLHDEMIGQGVLYLDPARQALDSMVAPPTRPLHSAALRCAVDAPSVESGLTRSPPRS
ncbi:MAG: hypothetical protein ACREJG_06140 [Candidatus Rokuibacteriota bacterium]